jgi:hypothetical protein
MMLMEARVVVPLGALIIKCVAALLKTLIEVDVPLIEDAAESVAVMVVLAIIFSVAEKAPVPFVSVELGGKTACRSVLEKRVVPE